jgi:hypothetical protein
MSSKSPEARARLKAISQRRDGARQSKAPVLKYASACSACQGRPVRSCHLAGISEATTITAIVAAPQSANHRVREIGSIGSLCPRDQTSDKASSFEIAPPQDEEQLLPMPRNASW